MQMNGDEIVRELRGFYTVRGECDEHNACAAQELIIKAADLITSLRTQLADSKRREQAAVEALKRGADACDICKHNGSQADCDVECDTCELICACKDCHMGANFEMRGPREGKGETE